MRARPDFIELNDLYSKADPAGLEAIRDSIKYLKRDDRDHAIFSEFNTKTIQAAISYLKAPTSIDTYIAIFEQNRVQRKLISEDSKLIRMLRSQIPFSKMTCLSKLENLKATIEAESKNLPEATVKQATKVYEECKRRLSAPALNPAEYKYIGSTLNYHSHLLKNPNIEPHGIEAPSALAAVSALSIFREKPSSKMFKLEYEAENLSNILKGITMIVAGCLVVLLGQPVLAMILVENGGNLMDKSIGNLGLSIEPLECMNSQKI